MKDKNFWLGAWLFLAVASSVATANSLTLSIEMKPFWLWFILWFGLAIIMYRLSSKFLEEVVKESMPTYSRSLSNGGVWTRIILFIFLWGILSMPTNTHSLLYQKKISNVVLSELETQKDIFISEHSKTNDKIDADFKNDSASLVTDINRMMTEFINEAFYIDSKGEKRPGIGPRCDTILNNIESRCGYEPRSRFLRENRSDVEYYLRQIRDLKDGTIRKLKTEADNKLRQFDNRQIVLQQAIDTTDKYITMYKRDRVKNTDVKEIIEDNYNKDSVSTALIYDRMEVLKKEAKGVYKGKNVAHYNNYRVSRLYNVFNVWSDFLHGRLGRLDFGMLYWILISVVIDLAAFLCWLKYKGII